MGFLSSLRSWLADGPRHDASEEAIERFRNAWGLDDDDAASPAEASRIAPGPDAAAASAYDRKQWRKKLHNFFEKFPATDSEWPDLEHEAKALKLGDDWVAAGVDEEFTMMIRSLIADRRLSEEEQARLEAVRKRIGMSVAKADSLVRAAVADAQKFFGGDIVIEH